MLAVRCATLPMLSTPGYAVIAGVGAARFPLLAPAVLAAALRALARCRDRADVTAGRIRAGRIGPVTVL